MPIRDHALFLRILNITMNCWGERTVRRENPQTHTYKQPATNYIKG